MPLEMPDRPAVSVVINTDNRPESLRQTLLGLEQLDYDNFEVVVVNGPTDDGTDRVVAEFGDRVKVVDCARRNLSESRNLGIKAAAGELVAFIDDDAYPDPAWLDELVGAFENPEIAGAGGPVFDHTGATFQAKFSQASVFGTAWADPNEDVELADTFQFPGTRHFIYPIGTNALFRRDLLLEIGGFDEEFEYYLDETDVCKRLIDRGYAIKAMPSGYVYHKFLPSDIRQESRAIKDRYSVLKNTTYFAVKHALKEASFAEVCIELTEFIASNREDFLMHLDLGNLTQADYDKFESDVPAAFNVGFERAMSGQDKTRDQAWFGDGGEFLPFGSELPDVRRHICLLIQDYPPKMVHGIARVTHSLALCLARQGHVVRILTRGEDHDRVDLEDGVWVHRLVSRRHPQNTEPRLPRRAWNHSASLLDELERIDEIRPIDVVMGSNWDSEGLAALLAERWPVVTGLYTPIGTVASMEPTMIESVRAGNKDIGQLIAADRFMCTRGDHFLASTDAIVREVESLYHLSLRDKHVGYVPLGIDDIAQDAGDRVETGTTDVVFVGRLEGRKGIDVLLKVVPDLCREFPNARFRLIGDHSIPGPDGPTYREEFERSFANLDVLDQVEFAGAVDDSDLYAAYRDGAIVVVPSRFESFGLTVLEGAAFGIPAVASAVGGMASLVDDGRTGLLVDPDEPEQLHDALARLLGDDELRRAYGQAARERFLASYTSDHMAAGMLDFMIECIEIGVRLPAASSPVSVEDPTADLAFEETELASILRCTQCRGPVVAEVATQISDGTLKTGRILCPACELAVAEVSQSRYDWLSPAPGGALGTSTDRRVVGRLGERRISASADDVKREGAWHTGGAIMVSEGIDGGSLTYTGTFTDAIVRLQRWPWGGKVEVLLDGQVVAEFDGYMEAGSQVCPVEAASDLPLARRTLTVRPVGKAVAASHGAQVAVEEFVLKAPLDAETSEFAAAQPINRGNNFSAVIERYLQAQDPQAWILEVGGGDRRRCNPRHLNLEYLDFELADMRGDIERLPFADSSFDFVFTQAVFEHVRDPFVAARELIRVTKPGQLILTEVAFLQPLHAVPYHYFNMTQWGVNELFADCEIVESDWFGGLGPTVQWLLETTGVAEKVGSDPIDRIVRDVTALDAVMTHDELRPVASGVYAVVRKPQIAG